jgi:hypothetical protein
MAVGSYGWDMAMHRLTRVAHGLGVAVSHCGRACGHSGAEQYPRQRVPVAISESRWPRRTVGASGVDANCSRGLRFIVAATDKAEAVSNVQG